MTQLSKLDLENWKGFYYLHTCKTNVTKMDTMTQEPRKRKSERLTPDEIKAFKKFRKDFNTDVECAESIGIKREVMIRVGILGSASPDTIQKIRIKLGEQK